MFQGFYINLDRNEERRKALEEHLEARGATARYRRLPAVDGRAVIEQHPTDMVPGNLGLWLTHTRLAEASRGCRFHLHLIEDDTIFAENAVYQFDTILEQADEKLPDWDLIFTEIHVPIDDVRLFCSLAEIMTGWWRGENLKLFNLKEVEFACTSSFFLNWRSIDKYAGLISNQWKQGMPIDLYLRDVVSQGLLNAYLTVPFTTSLSPHTLQSDIADKTDPSLALDTLYRRAFFQGSDLPSLSAEIQYLTDGADLSPLAAIFMATLRFRLSNQWVGF